MNRDKWILLALYITAAWAAGVQFAIGLLLIIQRGHASPIPCFCAGFLLLLLAICNGIWATKVGP